MKLLLALSSAVALFASVAVLPAEENSAEVQSRKSALDLAAAFSNDGFKIRDGHWTSAMKSGDHALIAVNLYSGNQYWFSVGADVAPKKLSVEIYDETGRQVLPERYDSGDKAAAGFSPTASGQYFVSIGLIEGDPTTLSLIYSYK